jgi:uncharacterized membrane protein YdbT with pleckstrin-like domain
MDTPIIHQSDLTRLQQLTGIRLREDEEVIFIGVIHGAVMWKAVAVLILAALSLLIAVNLALFFAFVGIVMLVIANVTRQYLLLAATNHRILLRGGLIYADVIELHYRQLESVEVGATVIGQLFGYVNVIVSGTGTRRIMVPFVANGVEFKRIVNDILISQDR